MFGQFAVIAGARALNSIAVAVIFIFLARDLGAASFGVFAALVAIQQILLVVAGLNAPAYIAREDALGRATRVRSALKVNALSLSAGVALAAASVALDTTHLVTGLVVALLSNAVAGGLDLLGDARLAVAISRQERKRPASAIAIRALLLSGVFVSLVSIGQDGLIAFAVARFLASLVGYTAARLLVHPDRASPHAMRSTLMEMMPLSITSSLAALRGLDTTLISVFAGAAAGGIYAAAARLLAPAGLLSSAMSSVVMGRAAQASATSVRKRFDQLFVFMCALTVAPLAILPFASELMVFIFGASYGGGGLVLVLVLMRCGWLLAGSVQVTLLQAVRLDRIVMTNSILVTGLSIAAFVVGSLVASAAGAALGYLVVTVLGFTRLWVVGRSRIGR